MKLPSAMTRIIMKIGSQILFLWTIDDPMKTVNSILFFSFIILSLTSCTKESFDQKIVGKWEIREEFAGYAMGGNFQWNAIPDQHRYSIEFREDGNFTETRAPGNSPNVCAGNYTIQ
jgi:hypothetical protein